MRSFPGMDVVPTPPRVYPPPRSFPLPANAPDGGAGEGVPDPLPAPEASTSVGWLLLAMFALVFVQSRRWRRSPRASSTVASSRRTDAR